MEIRFKREPTPKQLEFINAGQFEQVFGGAKRGGKTIAAGMKVALLSYMFPGNRGLLARADFTDLQRTTLAEFFDTVPDDLIAEHNKTEHRIEMKTCKAGVTSQILYSGLGQTKEIEKVKSLNLGWLLIDEPSEIQYATYKMVRAQLTWILPDGTRPPYMAMLVTNPEPGWIKDEYIDKPCDGKRRIYIPARPSDNTFLPPNWEDEQRAANDVEWVRKYLDGDWTINEGTVFKEYRPEIHEIDEIDVSGMKLVAGLDHAATGVVAFNAVAIDHYSNVFVLEEYYQSDRLISQHCAAIAEVMLRYAPPALVRGQPRRKFDYILIDPSTAQRTHQGAQQLESIQSLYRQNGINTVLAWNELEAGLERVKQAIHVDPTHQHPITGQIGSPRLFFVRNMCRNTIKELREIRKVVTDTGRVAFRGSDHGLDTIRYIMNAQFKPPSLPSSYSAEVNVAEHAARKAHERWATSFAAQAGVVNQNAVYGSHMWGQASRRLGAKGKRT